MNPFSEAAQTETDAKLPGGAMSESKTKTLQEIVAEMAKKGEPVPAGMRQLAEFEKERMSYMRISPLLTQLDVPL